ncbi:DNA-binding transcriptional regulator, AcrR family [Nonomuraea solani]|uniref:DNA-binding transcriptional regulator, AcrR family n=1 Tax=Nonomuraea solani TaxID=1144553 RepID=A0A1H6F0N8_9ACTN|nr:DNA-binding transcriptional regulator, AcrR family [Nonomuraea solani]
MRLFTRHSFAGTSLQMIADELGVTKAAVYHHFRTREDLLTTVVEPVLEQLRGIIGTAETKRTPHARAEHLLTGYVALAVEHRAVVAVFATDAGAIEMLCAQPETSDLVDRQMALLAGVTPGPAGHVNATMVMAGIAAATGPAMLSLDDDALRQHLIEAGRRALGLRAPRRPTRDETPHQQASIA